MPRPIFRAFALAAVLASLAAPALAERDIVFAARFYSAPAGGRANRFHLYRINPDGSRLTPLTFGAHDDENPRWSPDGRWVAFTRDQSQLCVIPASGGSVRVLSPSHDNRHAASGAFIRIKKAEWLSGSRRLLLIGGDSGPARTIDAPSGRSRALSSPLIDAVASPFGTRVYALGMDGVAAIVDAKSPTLENRRKLSGDLRYAAWLTPRIIVGTVESEGDASDSLAAYDAVSGRKLWDRAFALAQPTDNDLGLSFRGTTAIPGDAVHVILASDISSSTFRPDNDYYRVEITTGKASLWLRRTQYVVFRPDGRRYAASPVRDLTDYGPKRGARQPQVWTADLRVGVSAADPKPRAIVHGLAFVTGADWRK